MSFFLYNNSNHSDEGVCYLFLLHLFVIPDVDQALVSDVNKELNLVVWLHNCKCKEIALSSSPYVNHSCEAYKTQNDLPYMQHHATHTIGATSGIQSMVRVLLFKSRARPGVAIPPSSYRQHFFYAVVVSFCQHE